MVGADGNGTVLIRLLTIGCDNKGSRVNLRTSHVNNGMRWEGVEIADWSIVNFDARFQKDNATLDEIYVRIYRVLCDELV